MDINFYEIFKSKLNSDVTEQDFIRIEGMACDCASDTLSDEGKDVDENIEEWFELVECSIENLLAEYEMADFSTY